MRKAILRWIISAVAVYLAVSVIPTFDLGGNWITYLLFALILGLVNALIVPLLKALTCPLMILTLGLFTIIINAVALLVAVRLANAFGMDVSTASFWSTILASLVISVTSFILSVLTGVNKDDD